MMCVIYLNLATTALNLIGSCLLIFATLQVRKATRLNREWSECLSASAMSAGTAETQSGSGLQPASAVGEAETPKDRP